MKQQSYICTSDKWICSLQMYYAVYTDTGVFSSGTVHIQKLENELRQPASTLIRGSRNFFRSAQVRGAW
ncbi:hypothetical protein Pmani_028277 [Petrolisthes manimaculis]|uniref:Uncharacterized protein n=1 Tax=Petrolisthes manimaculis TaxID=1843537 RepID=A0AAE1P2E9_9EUCA|nr:hypothetical protein Pmani_028277 [Petrolisthes manimaculis]